MLCTVTLSQASRRDGQWKGHSPPRVLIPTKSPGFSLALPPSNIFKSAGTMCTQIRMEGLLSVPWGKKRLLRGFLEPTRCCHDSFAGQNIFFDKADFGPSPLPVSVAAPSVHGVGARGEQKWGAEGEAISQGTSP